MGLLRITSEIRDRDAELQTKSMSWKSRKEAKKISLDYNMLKQSVHILEKEFAHLESCTRSQLPEGRMQAFINFLGGIICTCLSTLWVLHVLLYVLIRDDNNQPAALVLNGMLMWLEESGLFVLAAIFFGLLNIYLLVCTVKGCLKIGMRAFCIFSIHPMERGKTPLNSMMFNCILLQFTTCAIVQFSQTAFADYARATEATIVFAAQIRYLEFYAYFFKDDLFIYLLLGWAVLCFFYLLLHPRDRAAVYTSNAKDELKMHKLVALHDPTPINSDAEQQANGKDPKSGKGKKEKKKSNKG